MRNARLEDVLDRIEKNSEFFFMYNKSMINVDRKIDIKVEDKNVSEVLNKIFENTDISYSIKDRQILLINRSVDVKGESMTQQQKDISGKVTDSSGVPLPGVTVVLKGTTSGTITNVTGNFTLSNIPNDATLIFSFIGLKTQEIFMAGKNAINVTMTEETIGIDEVVAIGYGTVKKQDLTGAVSSLGGDKIMERKTLKPTEALQGAIPGVTVTRSSGAPGDDPSILIRGVTTIGTNTPLVIIDGVQGLLSTINPNDIESISVLKDAASASIYGSKAAAGVILVTTKRAKLGQTNLDYDFEYGFETPTRLPKYLSAKPYMKLINEKVWNDNNNLGTEYPTYSKELIESYTSLNAENPNKYPDTDWATYLNDYAPRQRHLLSLSSGEKNIRSLTAFHIIIRYVYYHLLLITSKKIENMFVHGQ
jgi:TonB-linked SusC/RagA family outer membrane protein